MTQHTDRKIDRIFIFALFGAALATNFYLATINWTFEFMSGHEFRQTQTAIISYYIDQQDNFSIHYETPILGKPWEIPLEFPLYEWCVVLLSRATDWPHFISARTISLASFYASLPAFYLLLGQVGMNRVRRFVVLALLLVTPVYIFYSRAFLIDPMAFMLSVWFLALFIETMRKRRWGLLLACMICATAAGLIKSLVLLAWIFPAALYGAYLLWCDIRENRGKGAIARTLGWGLGTVVVPVIAMTWWVRLTDAIKAKHASAYIFTSESLSRDNYGTFSLSSRTSLETWKELFARWQEAIAQPWVIGLLLGLGAFCFPRERWKILGATGLFLMAQLVIPYAYAFQDYYFYICAAFVIIAFGFGLNGVLDSTLPRFGKWLLVLLPVAALLYSHHQVYFQHQSVRSHGGTQLTIALRDVLPEDTVIVVAGSDWAAMIPYYTRHRALMIRNGLESDGTYLARAFSDLAGEDVSALILLGDQRKNVALVHRAATAFGLDPSPAFFWDDYGAVYLNRLYRESVMNRLGSSSGYHGISLPGDRASQAPSAPIDAESLSAATMRVAFKTIQPTPTSFRLPYGYLTWDIDGISVLNAHPDMDIWIPAPATSKTVEMVFGIRKEAYEKEGDKTNGVEFILDAEASNGSVRTLFKRILDPLLAPADRGMQTARVDIDLVPGERLVVRTRPAGDAAYDWAYLGSVTVK